MAFRRPVVSILLLLVALLSGGCERQPGEKTLRAELMALIEKEFVPGLFEIRSVRRMGSAPKRDKTTGDDRLTVYFNAQLRFRRDFDLTAWDGPNAASLAFLLGATSKGLAGVLPGGNRENDTLRVHGSRVYARRRGAWQPLLIAARRPPDTGPKSGTQQTITRLSQLAERALQRYGGAEQAVIDEELSTSLKRIERQLDRLADVLSIASGPVGGAYYRFIKALEDNVERTGFRVRNHATQGSVENCQLVQAGGVDLAIAQSNVAALAIAGKGPFTQAGGLPDLRVLSALFPEYLQVVVSADPDITDLTALKGKRVDIGLPDSGSRLDALRLLDALGLRLPDFSDVRESGLEAAVAALQAGELDAFFTTIQAPNQTLQNLFARRQAHLMPITEEVREAMSAKYGSYRRAAVAAHTYPAQSEPVPTLSVTATLIVRADLPDSRVHEILEQLFQSASKLTRENLGLTLFSRESAREGVFMPLHPAAESYLSNREGRAAE